MTNNITHGPEKQTTDLEFIKGGPRSQIYFYPKKVIAAIVTCGGLCPGLNVVIREITYTLFQNYGVSKIYGIQYGYRGFYTYNWVELTPQTTKHIHKLGGTILGSSRGGFDLKKIMSRIKSKGVNQIYVIGGDGTLKGASAIYEYVKEKKLDNLRDQTEWIFMPSMDDPGQIKIFPCMPYGDYLFAPME